MTAAEDSKTLAHEKQCPSPLASPPPHHPVRTLVVCFITWKLVLFAIAAFSAIAGPAYDRSTSLMFSSQAYGVNIGKGEGNAHANAGRASGFSDATGKASILSPLAALVVERMTRWDAIWFTGIAAARGYPFEQAWAFGPGLPTVMVVLAKAIRALGGVSDGYGGKSISDTSIQSPELEALAGIVVATGAHFGAVFALYQLGLALGVGSRRSLVAALLHIISPAGLFLSAPYAESPYAMLSFLGMLLLASRNGQGHSYVAPKVRGISMSSWLRGWGHDLVTILAGVVFGVASMFRSNGLLNGLPLAVEFIVMGLAMLSAPSVPRIRRLLALGIAEILVALGSVVPQYWAYLEFCTGKAPGTELRPWCRKTIPSIYTFVQDHYWGVGFLRYWTRNNIGMFILGTPMIVVMLKSAMDVLITPSVLLPLTDTKNNSPSIHDPDQNIQMLLVRSLATTQLLIAGLSITNYHVQIITRLASGYPIWYLWLAAALSNKPTTGLAQGLVRFMVMYACIQGVLFACFLPPA